MTNFNGADFCGTFDGNGHKITGLNITSSRDSKYGLFGSTGSGSSVRNIQVEGKISVTGDNLYVGGVVGYACGNISNCSFKGSIEQNRNTRLYYVGGIAGYLERFCNISNCWADVDMTVRNSTGYTFMGGITNLEFYANVTNCYVLSNGTVSSVFGQNYGTVTSSAMVSEEDFKSGKVAYDLNANDGVDEIVWYQNIEGEVIDSDPTLDNSHAAVKLFNGSQYYNSTVTIGTLEELEAARDMINASTERGKGETFILTADIDMSGKYSGNTSWGTIGRPGSDTNYNTLNFMGTFDGGGHNIKIYIKSNSTSRQGLFGAIGEGAVVKNLSVSGSITSSHYGYTGSIAGENSGTIENCSSTAEVDGYTNTGGIAGINYGKIINCYNEGTVKNFLTYVGGIAGTNSGEIINCYNRGLVTCSMNMGLGGVVGTNSGTVTNCYYLKGTAKGGIDSSDAAGQAEVKNDEDFRSGNVAYLLNGSVNSENNVWKQTIGSQPYPEFEGLNVVGFTKSQEDIMFYGNEVKDGSVTISRPEEGAFTVAVDTSVYGGEGEAKYLEAVNVVVNDERAVQLTDYNYTEASERYAGFGVDYTGAQDYVIRGMVEAKDGGEAEKVMYYLTNAVTAPLYASETPESTEVLSETIQLSE